jgi:hypothetical protein
MLSILHFITPNRAVAHSLTHRPFSRAWIQCLQSAVLRLALRWALALLGFSSAQLGTLFLLVVASRYQQPFVLHFLIFNDRVSRCLVCEPPHLRYQPSIPLGVFSGAFCPRFRSVGGPETMREKNDGSINVSHKRRSQKSIILEMLLRRTAALLLALLVLQPLLEPDLVVDMPGVHRIMRSK